MELKDYIGQHITRGMAEKADRAKRQCSLALKLRDEQVSDGVVAPPWKHYFELAGRIMQMQERMNNEPSDGGEVRIF